MLTKQEAYFYGITLFAFCQHCSFVRKLTYTIEYMKIIPLLYKFYNWFPIFE